MSPNACAAAGWSASGPHVPGRGVRGRVQTFLTSYAVDLHSAPFLLLGILLLGGLVGGEAVRRLFNLPRTTGYVLTGIAAGPSGLGWVAPDVLQSAQFFVYLAIGVILFELGHRLPMPGRGLDRRLLGLSLADINGTFLAVGAVMLALGFGIGGALFAAAVAVSTSPAITIATTSDVGADGPATERLFALVAFNNCAAFVALAVALPILPLEGLTASLAGHAPPVAYVAGSLALGTALAAMACQGARWLGPQPEHQHLLLLGLICIGAGLPLGVQMSPLLTLLSLGVATRWMDVRGDVVGLRISSDARVFLVISFVLAGAALEIGLIVAHWREVAAFALARIAGRMLALRAAAGPLGVDAREAHWLGIGLLPKSSIALVLLGNAGPLSGDVGERLANVLLGAIALMQLVGPICTQMCSRGLGEARRLKGADPVTWMLARLPRRNG